MLRCVVRCSPSLQIFSEIKLSRNWVSWEQFSPSLQIFSEIKFKVKREYGTDQNIEIEIFAEYRYTLNELLVEKHVFQYV